MKKGTSKKLNEYWANRTLLAKNRCYTDDDENYPNLTIGKLYPIEEILRRGLVIINDSGDRHLFPFKEEGGTGKLADYFQVIEKGVIPNHFIYECEDNDVELQINQIDGEIDEILVGVKGMGEWTVVGCQDLKNALLRAKAVFAGRDNLRDTIRLK